MPTATTATAVDDGVVVREVVDRYWAIWLQLVKPPQPDDPRLGEVLTGAALGQTQKVMRQEAADHEAIRRPPHSLFRHTTQHVILVAPAQAIVTECIVDDTQLINVDSGAILNGDTTTFRLQDTVVRDGSGRWRISVSEQVGKWPGAVPCAD